ncbi:PucR family transcriptional regulator [Nocardia donostiensis]|uniref:Transcriptional regulator n=1 Tax=Nocardia donostiensis TaxID=1538463 RepID=A0A1V2TL70_9NOCA|nr:helix-turn-helix domain-containing protein [Nocardia donostiensis]ONM50228.1 transcriptional regulator [Nocardia donostiensis]OQS15889.1 transcriptional regulator [Nocardia donostiensis]OQS23696.1 transcriptional regulator [Nocardia donostiensis]
MTVIDPARSRLTVSGRPISAHLRDISTLSRQMVGHFAENVAPCGTLPGDALQGDVTAVTRVCLELTLSRLDGQELPEQVEQIRDAAAEWAREGIPIDTINHAIHEGFKLGFDRILSNASPADSATLVATARRLLEILDTITSAVAVAYVRENRMVVGEHHTAVHTLTSALLGGHSTSTMARECGIEIAESYSVLALAVPPHPDESEPDVNGAVVARRKLRRVQAELATRCGDRALSLLSVDGGTLLLPADDFAGDTLDELIAYLSEAARVPITATVVTAAPADIPAATEQAHELLDTVQRLTGGGGLHRFNDLALEFQITRPGPAREHLSSILDPLDEHPELLDTLRQHIANNFNRQRTARLMHMHTNTLDYRLKRVRLLTGFDPTTPSGLWYLTSALVARSYRAPQAKTGT